jgi:hypothetical protein
MKSAGGVGATPATVDQDSEIRSGEVRNNNSAA